MTRIEPADTDLPQSIVDAIRQAWPDSVVDKPDHRDDAPPWGTYQKLKASLSRIPGARVLFEAQPQLVLNPAEGSDEGEESSSDRDTGWRSYWLFFLSPTGEGFEFGTETIQPDEDGVEQQQQGQGWIGCVAGISIVAPFAVVSFDELEVFENGSRTEPDVEPHMFSLDMGKLDWDSHLREMIDEEERLILKNLRDGIVSVLRESEITVISEEDLDRPVPWLRAGEETLLGQRGEPINVRRAFFFRGWSPVAGSRDSA